MEGRSAHEATMRARKGSAYADRDGVGMWESALTIEPSSDTCHNFWATQGFTVPAHITNNVSAGLQTPQLSQIATKAPAYTPNRLLFPSIMLRGSSFSKKGNQSSFFPAFNDVDEMGMHKPMTHILGSSQAHSNKVDVQLSEVIQRRFVMFDRCGNKRRIIFHPSLMKDFPALSASRLPPKTGACNLDPLPDKAFSHRDPAMAASPFSFAGAVPVGSTFPYCNSHLLVRTAFMDSHSSASDSCGKPNSSSRDVEANEEQDGDGTPGLSCFSHENTEDLEALLSSDEDEVSSTGHSPSDLTRILSPLDTYSNNDGHIVCISKKRKDREECNMEDGDTCSTATSGMKVCKGAPCQNVDARDTKLSYGKESFVTPSKVALVEDLGHGTGDLTAFDMFLPDEVSSSSRANNPKWDNKLASMLPQDADGLSRKEKIKSILRHLRGIIPGGESMDAAFVLDEAIQYVKTLQSQVQKLQARKLL